MNTERLLNAIGTLIGSLIAAYVGSLYGARAALGRFKRERAFDRRLDWYDQVARTLAEVRLSLEIAQTFEEDPTEPPDKKRELWGKANGQYMELTRVEALSELYGSPVVVQKLRALREEFDAVSNETNGFDAIALPKRLDLVQRLIDSVHEVIPIHAAAVRKELEFERLRPGDDSTTDA